MAKKGDWVRIHNIVLESDRRAAQVPDDTKKVPLEMWVKGRLTEDAEIGDTVTVITRTKREATGRLLEVNPTYTHDYGKFVPELLEVSEQVWDACFGGETK